MANKKIPLRKCVACNEMKEKKEMIRVIKTPENEIVLDALFPSNFVFFNLSKISCDFIFNSFASS